MNKKKIIALVITGLLAVGIVGGTLAWFTASDSITNKFEIGTTENPDDIDAGIEIEENWNPEEAKNLTPGANVNKDVQVHSTASYDQFIRVKLTKQYTKNNVVVTENLDKTLDTTHIILNFTERLKDTKVEGTWYYNDADEYYYYIGKVGKESFTNTLLDSVTFGGASTGNEYKNLGFDVIVDADSIQASHDAYKDWAPVELHSDFETLQAGSITTPEDDELPTPVTP